jgi:hypothetical protein
VRIARFTRDESGQVHIVPPAYDATWSVGLTHVLTAVHGNDAMLITHNAATGTTELRIVAGDVQHWPDTLQMAAKTQVWGFNPPWDVIEIVGQGKW